MIAHAGAAGAPVVAGIDGSPDGTAVLLAAAREASLRRRSLHIVRTFTWPPAPWTVLPDLSPLSRRQCREQAENDVAEALDHLGEHAPGVPVTAEVAEGPPESTLLAATDDAVLLAMGDRGSGALLHSAAVQVAGHGRCPVLVVRGHRHPDGPVVAGVDGSPGSVPALRFAAEEAALRGADLVALHAWNGNDSTELNADLPMTYEFWSGDDEERRVLAEALAGVAERYPDLRIRRQVRRGSARRMLHDWSLTAQLVVVGDRGHSAFAGILLGSVSHHLLLHAGCPTAVVRPALARAEA